MSFEAFAKTFDSVQVSAMSMPTQRASHGGKVRLSKAKKRKGIMGFLSSFSEATSSSSPPSDLNDTDDISAEIEFQDPSPSLHGVEPSLEEDNSEVIHTYRVSQAVEARFGGKAKYYKGEVTSVNGDGTYEIRYEDGDSEKAVAEDMICAPSVAGVHVEGQCVEARFGGKNKWYGGVIIKDNGDGTYGVRYDDGDSELAVVFVRAVEPSPPDEDKLDQAVVSMG